LKGFSVVERSPLATAIMIKVRIKQKVGLTASVGLGPNKMAAKIASDINKPDGLTEIKSGDLVSFLTPLGIDKIWGLGDKSKQILNSMGINTIGDLANADIRRINKVFGKSAYHWQELAQGKDNSLVESRESVKSVSNEITFKKDTQDIKYIESGLMYLSEKVSFRLRKLKLRSKTITLKIRLEGFCTYTRSITVFNATNFSDTIYKIAKKLFGEFWLTERKVRLLGIRLTNFIETDTSENIFPEPAYEKRKRIHAAIDQIKDKFGSKVIYRALAADFKP